MQNSESHINPLLNKDYGTPHNTPPFDRILFEDYEPAIMEALKLDNAFIDNTIAITTPDDMLERVTKVFFNLLSANTNDEMDALAQKLSPILTEHANNIMFNRAYFERVEAVYKQYADGSSFGVAATSSSRSRCS